MDRWMTYVLLLMLLVSNTFLRFSKGCVLNLRLGCGCGWMSGLVKAWLQRDKKDGERENTTKRINAGKPANNIEGISQ
jgi:hypothetical protein